MSKVKFAAPALVAFLGLGWATSTSQAAEVKIKKIIFNTIPVLAEVHLTHGEVEDIGKGAQVPIPAPWGTAVKVVAGTLKTFDRGNGVKVMIPIPVMAPIVVLPR
jgi:hypothetical protein